VGVERLRDSRSGHPASVRDERAGPVQALDAARPELVGGVDHDPITERTRLPEDVIDLRPRNREDDGVARRDGLRRRCGAGSRQVPRQRFEFLCAA
jgi:hypothetical protein